MKEFAPYYFTVYMMAVIFLTIYKYSLMQPLRGYQVLYHRDNNFSMIVFSVFFVLMFGFRPIAYEFGDTVMYNASYQIMHTAGTLEAAQVSEASSDWLFYGFMFLCSQVVDIYYFFVIVMYFYIALMFSGCMKLDSRHGAILMLFCIGAFSFYGYAINGIRNGVACSFVILALAEICRGSRISPIILAFIAVSCHKSTALPLVCMFFTYFVRSPRFMYCTWIGAILVSLFFGEAITSVMSLLSFDERLTVVGKSGEDVANEWGVEMENRFRWDFLLYSSMPIFLGAYTLFMRKVYNNTYLILLGTYIYANAFWIIVIRDLFSNRFAYLSWFLYPIVLAYPLLNLPVFKKDHSQKTSWILMAHLGFTVLMWTLGKM